MQRPRSRPGLEPSGQRAAMWPGERSSRRPRGPRRPGGAQVLAGGLCKQVPEGERTRPWRYGPWWLLFSKRDFKSRLVSVRGRTDALCERGLHSVSHVTAGESGLRKEDRKCREDTKVYNGT